MADGNSTTLEALGITDEQLMTLFAKYDSQIKGRVEKGQKPLNASPIITSMLLLNQKIKKGELSVNQGLNLLDTMIEELVNETIKVKMTVK